MNFAVIDSLPVSGKPKTIRSGTLDEQRMLVLVVPDCAMRDVLGPIAMMEEAARSDA